MDLSAAVNAITVEKLAHVLRVKAGCDDLMIMDTRSFLEYNDSHIQGAVNIGCSKFVTRALEKGTLSLHSLLDSINCRVIDTAKIVIYDQCSYYIDSIPRNSFFSVIVQKITECYKDVSLLEGGFSEFSFKYPKLCESGRATGCPLLSISTPCASSQVSCPPTKVLPFLYLGCEEDALSEDVLKACRIKYVLNVSQSAVDTPHIGTGHYMKIPVRDSANENIMDWFKIAFDFIDKVKESDDHLLLHCVGGVSRSATMAIGYVMRHLSLSLDCAYRYVKEKRPSISPNLNFMGQLLQYEQQLRKDRTLFCSPLEGLSLAESQSDVRSQVTTGNFRVSPSSRVGDGKESPLDLFPTPAATPEFDCSDTRCGGATSARGLSLELSPCGADFPARRKDLRFSFDPRVPITDRGSECS